MTDKTEIQVGQETPEQLLHDIATPLLITQMNADLLAKYLSQLTEALNHPQPSSDLLHDEKIVTALTGACNAIKNNISIVQTKVRYLSHVIENSNYKTTKKRNLSSATEKAPKPLVVDIKNILLVDDETVHRDIGLSLLSPKYNVETANNGLEAISTCKHKHYDLILMDLQMPKMNGVEATGELRKFISANTLIVGLTSMPVGNTRTELIELGFDNFIEKPLKLESFQNMLRLHSIND